MSRRLMELEPSTPTRAITPVSSPSPMTRGMPPDILLYVFLFVISISLTCFCTHLQPQEDAI